MTRSSSLRWKPWEHSYFICLVDLCIPNTWNSGWLWEGAQLKIVSSQGFLGGCSRNEAACQCRRHRRCGFNPWVRKIPWRRAWQPTPLFLSGKSRGQRNLSATVHRVAKSQTQLKQLSMFAHAHYTCLPKSNAKFWWGCGIIIGTVLPCSWEYKMVQPFCKTVWQFLTKLNILLPYEPAILLLGIYPKSWKLVSTKTLAHGSLQQQLFA